jgi:hypothetical protein
MTLARRTSVIIPAFNEEHAVVLSVVIVLIGLVLEQISSLRFEGRTS